MRPWNVVVPAALATLTVVATGCSPVERPPAPEGPRTRGIVLVTVDGLESDELTLFGGGTRLPALERLAAQGRAWRDGWTACPMPRPGAATYLTGLAPDRHGVLDDAFDVLPDDMPTLATLLSDGGFRTAAFPDSSLLGHDSGLLRGFEVVDDPPPVNLGAGRRVPSRSSGVAQAEHFAAWLRGLGPDQRFFAWIHSSAPLLRQMRLRTDDPAVAARLDGLLGEFDALVSAVSSAVEERGPGARVAVIVAGTLGDVSGKHDGLAGIGFSLGEAASRVPVVARFADDVGEVRSPDAAVWAPDVAVTLAHLGGVVLAGSEGVDLFTEVDADRALFAWSRATRDQMGWPAQHSVRRAGALKIAGLGDSTSALGTAAGPVDAATMIVLGTALEARPVPAGARLALDAVRPLLEAQGLKLRTVGPEGRAVLSAEARREVALSVWHAAIGIARERAPFAIRNLASAGQREPGNLAALLLRGQLLLAAGKTDEAAGWIERSVELYAEDPETVHWYVHAHWERDAGARDRLLEALVAVRPRDPDVLYDLACARSRAGDMERSEAYLRRAIDAGADYWEHMESDPDLRGLRESGRFAQILREHRR